MSPVNPAKRHEIPLLLASANAHKLSEVQDILGPGFPCHGLQNFPNYPGIDETGTTFEANARLKAESLARWLGEHPVHLSNLIPADRGDAVTSLMVLADDSGLEVDALNGAPGVHSARFAYLDTGQPGNAPDQANNEKLLQLLIDIPTERRSARFKCVLALIRCSRSHLGDPARWEVKIFEGVCEGRLLHRPSGMGGFGYDPLFVPCGQDASLGVLASSVKNRISHRSAALRAFKASLNRESSPESS